MTNATVALLLFGTCAFLLIVVGGPMQFADAQYGLVGSELVAMLLPAVAVGFAISKRADRPAPLRFGSLGFDLRGVLWLIVTASVLGIAATTVTGLLSELVPGWRELAASYDAMFQALMFPDDPVRRVAAIAGIVLVAPLCEEIAFRGVMLPLLKADLPSAAPAIVINGALFGLIHLNPLSFIALFVVGVFFAHVAVVSGSIWPSVIAHATLNFVNGVIAPRILSEMGASAEIGALGYGIASFVFTALCAVLWIAGMRRFGARNQDA